MTRTEIFNAIRDHLADELQLDVERISEETHFKQDLAADSLDLYTLIQELEDSYGVKMSDEEAVKIVTVGQAVDFVIGQTQGVSSGGRTDSSQTHSDQSVSGMSSAGGE